ncbi:uncharacterized protein LOC129981451 [Argiope bruennichi]|uniref:uncharacterized protein LOC129959680 n=1 Tax=Argiope bruennichi TaxID=94029 RepID=UPI0024942657|nr:uncharacterized protein LOC129959680 [Argiope bruennichi]XP_055948269.1 uncharacterized protein LOC129981451 [Argiope bruennichi]
MRSGDLLVEVNSRKQAQQIQKIKNLATIPVTVNPHQSLNTSKGVITCGELLNVPLEVIIAEMKPQGVTNVRRITLRRDGELLETKHHILTFNTPKLPEFAYAGYIRLPVRPYIPNPLRCFHCQRFGHSKMNCRGSLTCARCAGKGHDSQECSAQEKCVNCSGNHPSYSRSCPRWILEKQITTVKFKEDITYPEARRKVQAQTPTPGKSYASVLQNTYCSNCSCANCVKNSKKYKPPEKLTDSDSEKSINDTSEKSINDTSDTPKVVKTKSKRKKQSSLTLKLAKRGLSQKDLPLKLKKSTSKNSVALGMAMQGNVHKDLTTIFGDKLHSPDIKLHPSEDEDELDMSCDDPATQTNASVLSPAKHLS